MRMAISMKESGLVMCEKEMVEWGASVGTVDYYDGSQYKGQYKHDKKTGKGTMKYANGDTYEGDWLNDEREGEGKSKVNKAGVHVSRSGDKYKGSWRRGRKQGKGKTNHKCRPHGVPGRRRVRGPVVGRR